MKKWYWLTCVVFLLPCIGLSQGIRKNYTDMTQNEQQSFVNAMWGIFNSDPSQDLVQTLSSDASSSYYWNYYDDVFMADCQTRQFLPFHRMLLWEMENAIQRQNPRLTIPYWDWTVNNSSGDALFTSFLNPYVLPPWNIIRTMDGYSALPTTSQIQSILGSGVYCDNDNPANSFNDQMEYPLTIQITNWVGGTIDDPRDPIFFLHHAMVDKIWQQWQTTQMGSWTDAAVLDRYDGGTNSVYISPLPYTDPNTIVDGRTMGIFYADNGVANLDGGYQVQNVYQNPEYFAYQYQIVASDFTVPTGKSAVFASATGVELAPGFVVDQGSLEIDVGSDMYDKFFLSKKEGGKPFVQPKDQGAGALDQMSIVRSSEGFTAHFQLQNSAEVHGYVMGIDGKIVSRVNAGQLESGSHDLEVRIPQSGNGLYYGYFQVGDQTYKRLLPRF